MYVVPAFMGDSDKLNAIVSRFVCFHDVSARVLFNGVNGTEYTVYKHTTCSFACLLQVCRSIHVIAKITSF